jgi:acetyltransferase EpsM
MKTTVGKHGGRKQIHQWLPKNDSQNIVVIGAGWHGSEVYSYLLDLMAQNGSIHLVGFIDEHKPHGAWRGTEILGNFDDLKSLLRRHTDIPFCYITATGDNRVRQQFVQKIESLSMHNLIAWTLRHPRSIVGYNVEVGEGTCLAPGSIITTHARIGKHCILNVNASVSHDCVIGDFVNINPGAVVCGNVNVGEGCYIGAGATIIDKVSIGDWSTIGAGAVVIHDIPPYVTAVGVPARVIKENRLGEEEGEEGSKGE